MTTPYRPRLKDGSAGHAVGANHRAAANYADHLKEMSGSEPRP